MYRTALGFSMSMLFVHSLAMAQDNVKEKNGPPVTRPSSVLQISPIFSQLVMFAFPAGFKTVFENMSPDRSRYIRESVLDGETVDRWSQMITVTGGKGLAAIPNLTPQIFAERIVGGFKQRACPETFFAKGLGAIKISGQDAFIVLAGCGSVASGAARHSETVLLISIKGTADYYTIQWAERGAASSQPIVPDESTWTDRLRKLNPIKICARVPGEPAPYPSCVSQK